MDGLVWFLLGIPSGIATSVVAAGVIWWIRARVEAEIKRRSPHGVLFSFKRSRNIVMVFKTRDPDPKERRPFRQVGMEDMLAMNYLNRALGLCGWGDDQISFRTQERFAPLRREPQREDDKADDNVILVCSHAVTKEALGLYRDLRLFDGRFVEETNGSVPRIGIKLNNFDTQFSPSFEQEKAMLDNGVDLREGMVEDYALIVKAPNPWSRADASLFIVAGVRGIGTWGAAQHLRLCPDQFFEEFGEGNFACIVKVTYLSWRIERVRSTDIFVKLSDKLDRQRLEAIQARTPVGSARV